MSTAGSAITTAPPTPHRRGRARPRGRVVVALIAVATIAGCTGDGDTPADAPADTPTNAPAEPEPGSTSDEPGPSTTAVSGSEPADVPDDGASPSPPADGGSECPTGARDGEPVEITFWHAMSATNGAVLEELLAEWDELRTDATVTPVFQGGYAEAFGKYVGTLRSGGELPTLVQLSELYLQPMVDSRSIVPIESCIADAGYDLTDFPPALLDQYRLDGELVTMPFNLSNPVLFYDGNDFEAAGLDPATPPTTLDELVAVARTLVDAEVVPSAIAIDIDAWPIEQWIATAGEPLVDHDNGRTGRAERAQLDTPVVTDLLTTLQDLHAEGLLQVTGRGGEQAGLAPYIAVAQGNATMTIGSSATLGEIYEQIGRAPDVDVRVGPFPGLGGRPNIGGGSLYLTGAATDDERAAAWDLLSWLNEPAQQVRWSIATGYVPTRTSSIEDPVLVSAWSERPGFRVAWDQLAEPGQVPGGGGPVIGDYLGVRDAIEDGLEALYAGDAAADVQGDVQAAADQVIEAYNDRIGG